MHEHQKFFSEIAFWVSKQVSISCVSSLCCVSIEMNLLSAKTVEFSASDLALGAEITPIDLIDVG